MKRLVAMILIAFLFSANGNAEAASAPTPEIWFGMRATKAPGGHGDWSRVFLQPNAPWPESLDHVRVIFAGAEDLNDLSQEELAQVAVRLQQHHMAFALGILAQNWFGEAKCGGGVEGYSDPAGNARVVAKLQAAGLRPRFISMDEPLYFGHYYDGQNACHSSLDDIAERVSKILGLYLKAFSNALVIDTEPFPAISGHPNWESDYKDWMTAFQAAIGQPISTLLIDINWPDARWEGSLGSIVSLAHRQSLRAGIIYWAAPPGGATSNEQWLDSAAQNFTRIERGMGLVPDIAMFTSWSKFPERSITDSNGLGEDYLVQQYVRMHQLQ